MKASLRWMNVIGPSSMRSRSTSFIGLGRMGHEMAYNLFSKQFAHANENRFVVCDAIPESAQRFCSNFVKQYPGANINIANTPEEATRASQTIITMLPSSPQILSVYHDGIIPTLRKLPADQAESTFCIDSTTLDVDVARSVAKGVAEARSQMVDAPVSGGVTGAKAATLAFLVGGTVTGFKQAQPILALMGQRIIHCGPSGAGLAAKICNNLILGVQQMVVGEAMLLGTKLGLDPAVLSSVISSSTGNCWSISVNNPVPHALPEKSPPCEREYEGGFATALMLKDMGLASNVAALAGCPVPLGQAAETLYAQMVEEQPELAQKDFSSVYKFLKQVMEDGKTIKA
ncbi:NAD binding domain of 6-phosphogluconate dehydrogenase-domain-containing protein [Lentinula aff. detonsa]|uniref:3-hydroxyisobutyrate dehydrogenase n=1 Tax=Lentinula aff. detonsa TaxID=2804958 RepID=A0AA38NJ39_9AGAR|nr:NAD binding domain of 6-phosphogluconate dehydrogenase-domain-containing protein [Lentinula aff. detonsa]KAJ3802413.1 NAD binding domain of 6-phosphogluconate dehydrogenase-domain-containing protein [Lentinula aff. detonsa]